MFANGKGDHDSVPGKTIPGIQKMYLMFLCLAFSITRHGSRITGPTEEKEYQPNLYLGVVANEKEAFKFSST